MKTEIRITLIRLKEGIQGINILDKNTIRGLEEGNYIKHFCQNRYSITKKGLKAIKKNSLMV